MSGERPKVQVVDRQRRGRRGRVGVRRVPSDDPRARPLMQAKGAVAVDPDRSELTEEQRAWNEELARRQAAKKE